MNDPPSSTLDLDVLKYCWCCIMHMSCSETCLGSVLFICSFCCKPLFNAGEGAGNDWSLEGLLGEQCVADPAPVCTVAYINLKLLTLWFNLSSAVLLIDCCVDVPAKSSHAKSKDVHRH